MPRLVIKRIKMIKRETLKRREREAKRANQRVRQSSKDLSTPTNTNHPKKKVLQHGEQTLPSKPRFGRTLLSISKLKLKPKTPKMVQTSVSKS